MSAVVFQQVSGLFNMHMPQKNWLNLVCFFLGESSTTEQSFHNHSDNQAASCRIRCVDMVSATEEEKSSEHEDYINSKPDICLLLLDLSLTMSCEGQAILLHRRSELTKKKEKGSLQGESWVKESRRTTKIFKYRKKKKLTAIGERGTKMILMPSGLLSVHNP